MRPTILILCPSKGRPKQAARLVESFLATKPKHSKLVLAIECSDWWDYLDLINSEESDPVEFTQWTNENNSAAEKYNELSHVFQPRETHTIFGLGDDCVFVSPDWEQQILDARKYSHIVYGNDLLMGPRMCTHPAIDARLIRATGWFLNPAMKHLYADNVWMDIGCAMQSIAYLPGCVIEHRHFLNGKAEKDSTYFETNSKEHWESDKAAYDKWRFEQMRTDVEKCLEAVK